MGTIVRPPNQYEIAYLDLDATSRTAARKSEAVPAKALELLP